MPIENKYINHSKDDTGVKLFFNSFRSRTLAIWWKFKSKKGRQEKQILRLNQYLTGKED